MTALTAALYLALLGMAALGTAMVVGWILILLRPPERVACPYCANPDRLDNRNALGPYPGHCPFRSSEHGGADAPCVTDAWWVRRFGE